MILSDIKRCVRSHPTFTLTLCLSCLFVSVIGLISYSLAPDRFVYAEEADLVQYADFTTSKDLKEDAVASDHLFLHSLLRESAEGADVATLPKEATLRNSVFSAPVELSGLEGLWVEFTVEASPEAMGEALFFDLYAKDYDRGDQEIRTPLQDAPGGMIRVAAPIQLSEDAPDKASCRLFTSSTGPLVIRDLHIREAHFTGHTGMIVFQVILTLLLSGLLVYIIKCIFTREGVASSSGRAEEPEAEKTTKTEAGKTHAPEPVLQGIRGRQLALAYGLSILFSLLVFAYQFGLALPGFTDIAWQLKEADILQHQMGWMAYREGPWTWPLGMTDRLSYPYDVSIIFTDSIPILALIFKLLSPVLPDPFQYYILWTALCYVLQGALTVKVLKRFYRNPLALALTGPVLCLVPSLFARSLYHSALGGQWVLLLSMDLLLNQEAYKPRRKLLWASFMSGALVASVHIYLLLMAGIILVGAMLRDLLLEKKLSRFLGSIASFVAGAAVVVWALGGFAPGIEWESAGLGLYSLNLLSFVNTEGSSRFFGPLPIREGQEEEIAYLGLGLLLVVAVSLLGLLTGEMRKACRAFGRERIHSYLVAAYAVLMISLFLALSPIVTLGPEVLYRISFRIS